VISRDELALYLHGYLACDHFNDYAPNGVQVEGRSSINKICSAVTASEAVIQQAVEQHADALLVHHGYFWRGEEAVLTGMKRRRISKLLEHNLNLFAYHLPLDCHPDIGNNACLGKLLNFDAIKMHSVGKITNLLWQGILSKPLTAQEFAGQIFEKLKRTPLHVSGTDKPIQRVAWCSGGAQDYIEDANRLGVDAYFSGEISERTYYQAQELGIHYFACGHHATERYGIQALGQHLSERFKLEHQFIDSDNPV
jgi:dinuclear metal center YbgI/SA1388 family protein